MNKDWDWYGTWVIDYLCAEDLWEAFNIWKKTYLESNPEIEAEYEENCSLLFLLELHNSDPTLQSFPFKIDCFFCDCSLPWRWMLKSLRFGAKKILRMLTQRNNPTTK